MLCRCILLLALFGCVYARFAFIQSALQTTPCPRFLQKWGLQSRFTPHRRSLSMPGRAHKRLLMLPSALHDGFKADFNDEGTNRTSTQRATLLKENPPCPAGPCRGLRLLRKLNDYRPVALALQMATLLSIYFSHMIVMSRRSITLPIQLLPNPYGLFHSVGVDSLVGLICLTMMAHTYVESSMNESNTDESGTLHVNETTRMDEHHLNSTSSGSARWFLENLLYATQCFTNSFKLIRSAHRRALERPPWGLASSMSLSTNTRNKTLPLPQLQGPGTILRGSRLLLKDESLQKQQRAVATLVLLAGAYVGSGYVTGVIEYALLAASAAGFPLSVAMHRSLQVLLGHLVWVGAGWCIFTKILGTEFLCPRKVESCSPLAPFTPRREDRPRWWYSVSCLADIKSNWGLLWWGVGGYCVSAMAFNMVHVVNQLWINLIESIFKVNSVSWDHGRQETVR
eukprot:GHVN01070690.1.p1 GENE.GHVN01070690.1~~GHVN01070690.1.p1  ORF type:complete len:455 (+),score=18.33 GHVN01070690.1:89-1453(+)